MSQLSRISGEDPAASTSLLTFNESQPIAAVKALGGQIRLIGLCERLRNSSWAVQGVD